MKTWAFINTDNDTVGGMIEIGPEIEHHLKQGWKYELSASVSVISGDLIDVTLTPIVKENKCNKTL